jgi:hypothetical protein
MKKILFLITLTLFSITASAQYRHFGPRYYGPYYGGGGGWVAPVIIGGVIGYELSKANSQNTVIVQQPSVIVEQQPVNMECSMWKEVQSSDGKIYRERTCYQK